jgi:uncharacterized protein
MDDDSPFHEGEREVQARVGVRARAEHMGRRMIGSSMPDQHRAFFEQLPFVVVGSLDGQGRPWASILSGRPGFMFTPNEHTLRVRARVHGADPLLLEPGRALGLLGIELPTRRRNRVNGRILGASADGFTLGVDQSFGNCPMYINARVPQPADVAGGEARRLGPSLAADDVAWVRASDTGFIASAAGAIAGADAREGVDVSHRGGNPGFVRVSELDGQSVLTMPDFAGNNAFNTLGNLARYPRAGLSFPDFASGDLLMLSGRTELVWEGAELASFQGAQRLVRLYVEDGRVLPAQLPFVWSEREPARQLAETGRWPR